VIAQLTILGEGGVSRSGHRDCAGRRDEQSRDLYVGTAGEWAPWANGLADDVKVALTPYRRRPDRPHVCQMRANATAQVPPSCPFALLHVRLRHRRKVPLESHSWPALFAAAEGYTQRPELQRIWVVSLEWSAKVKRPGVRSSLSARA
jgi:hypothetical protein